MRTNIDIDDRLMQQAMRCSGTHTKKAAVEAGLHLLVETHAQRGIARLRGTRAARRQAVRAAKRALPEES